MIFGFLSLAFNRIVALAPQSLFPRIKNIDTDLEMSLKGRITGDFNAAQQLFPHIEAEMTTNGGHFAYTGSPTRIDRFKIDALLRYQPDMTDSTGIKLNDFDIEGSGIRLAGQASIWDLLGDPSVTTRVSGSVNLDTLSQLYPSDNMFVSGNLKINAIAKFRKTDLCIEKFGNTRIGGMLSTDSLLIDIPKDSLFLLTHNGTVQFGSGFRRFDSIEQFDEEMLRIRFDADSLDLRMKDQSRIAVSKASTTLQSAVASLSGDTTVVHPIPGNISAQTFDATLSDSSRMRLSRVNSSFGIKPSTDDPKIPELSLTFDAGNLHPGIVFINYGAGIIVYPFTHQQHGVIDIKQLADDSLVLRRQFVYTLHRMLVVPVLLGGPVVLFSDVVALQYGCYCFFLQ